MRFKLQLLLTIQFSIIVFGQVNIEQYRNYENNGNLKNNFEEHVNIATTIKRSTSSYYSLGLKYFKPVITDGYEGFLISKINYGETSNEVFINNAFYHFRLIAANQNNTTIPEAYAQFESNEYTLTNERYLAGIGIRYKIGNSISGTSIMNEWYKETNNTSRINNWRLSQYFTLLFNINPFNKLSTTIYFQPAISDLSNIRYYTEISFDSKLTETISYKSTLTSKFFSDSVDFNDVELFFESGLDFIL